MIDLATSDLQVRYPAVSADGRWLAYDAEERGTWQLHVMDLPTRVARQLTHGECNSTTPEWAPDSTYIVYLTDCGRAVGFTALYRIDFQP